MWAMVAATSRAQRASPTIAAWPRSPGVFHVERSAARYGEIGAVRARYPRAARSSDASHSL